MLAPKFIHLTLKYVFRHRTRSLLTISGVSTAMFLFYAVQAMQQGIHQATAKSAEDTTLVVYREDRFCPFTSHLPEDYGRKILKIAGVKSVVPIKIYVNNCRASLDVITFRGVPEDAFEQSLKHIRILEGSLDAWKRRGDAAIVGKRMAQKRNLKLGDRLDVGGITITVAGILDSEEPQDQNVAYTHLDFIQRSAGNKVGIVTQFNVIIDNPDQLDQIAESIDKEFRYAQEPTKTWSEKAFVARAVADIIEIINFAKWLGWGSLAAVFALVANAILLSVQDRIRDHAVFQTLGYSSYLIARLIVMEALLLSLLGGFLGIFTAFAFARYSQLSFSVEGISVNIYAGAQTIFLGLGLCVFIGIIAGLFPAWQASRREIAACFRAA